MFFIAIVNYIKEEEKNELERMARIEFDISMMRSRGALTLF